MFISSREIATIVGLELTFRITQWISTNTPVNCKLDTAYDNDITFDIDEALEYCKIKMLKDRTKKEFFPYLVKLKNYQVRGVFDTPRSA